MLFPGNSVSVKCLLLCRLLAWSGCGHLLAFAWEACNHLNNTWHIISFILSYLCFPDHHHDSSMFCVILYISIMLVCLLISYHRVKQQHGFGFLSLFAPVYFHFDTRFVLRWNCVSWRRKIAVRQDLLQVWKMRLMAETTMNRWISS